MIRFCDEKVYWIEYCTASNKYTLNRTELLDYFLDGHRSNVVCVREKYTRKFMGIITYQSLSCFSSVWEAVRTEYLVFNRDIWQNAHEYCRKHPYSGTKHLIPILDQEKQLYCFAYEDPDADREIRMLRELGELPDVVQFTDLYSEYRHVKICGFNELAYLFAKYLEILGVAVEVTGRMWQEFFVGQKYDGSDYECLTIYAEGVAGKKKYWKENLLRSVSVEFECIDKIYEENLRRGFIKDKNENRKALIAGLQNAETVAIFGTDIESQDAYDYLLCMEIDICCFVSETYKNHEVKLLGKPVLMLKECIAKYGNSIVFVDNHGQHSAFGCVVDDVFHVDYLDYMGYERNRKFFLLKDYIQIKSDCLKTILQKNQIVVLAGDAALCERLVKYYKNSECVGCQFQFLETQHQPAIRTKLDLADPAQLEKEVLILVVEPEYLGCTEEEGCKEKRGGISYLDLHHFTNYTDYFSYTKTWVALESETKNKYPLIGLQAGKIILGSIESCCGSYFFKGLLDNHPHIMLMCFDNFEADLFWFCVRLADKPADEVIEGFELLFRSASWLEEAEQKRSFRDGFIKRLSEILHQNPGHYTSQQLFILFYMAYTGLYGRNVENIREKVIYWAPHVLTAIIEAYTQWLGADDMPCWVVNVVRNLCMSKGSRIKGIFEFNWAHPEYAYKAVMEHYDGGWVPDTDNRIVLRFEDIKCNPKEELSDLCRKLGIPWSNSLMSTTHHNGQVWTYDNGRKKMQDFDLSSVYYNYEEYFSEFDRFRIALICASWQKRHGYPYVDIQIFSRRDLQEIFLKDYRFGSRIFFECSGKRLDFFINLQRYVRQLIQEEYMAVLLESSEKGDTGIGECY